MPRDPVTVVTPPSVEPVQPAELYRHLMLNTGSAEFPELVGFIRTARELFEQHTGRAVLPTTFRQHLTTLAGPVELLRAPVSALVAVRYYDAADVLQTATGWQLDADGTPAVVYHPDESYPALSTRRRRPAYVEFVAGWPDFNAVPAAVGTAIRLLAGHYYRHREAFSELPLRELPAGFGVLVEPWDTGTTRGA